MKSIKFKYLGMFFGLLSAAPSNFIAPNFIAPIIEGDVNITPVIARDPATNNLFFQYAMEGRFSFAEEPRKEGTTTFGLTCEAQRDIDNANAAVTVGINRARPFLNMKIELSLKGITLKFDHYTLGTLCFTYDPKFGTFLSEKKIIFSEPNECIAVYKLCMRVLTFNDTLEERLQSKKSELNKHYLELLCSFGYQLNSLKLCAREPLLSFIVNGKLKTLPEMLTKQVGSFLDTWIGCSLTVPPAASSSSYSRSDTSLRSGQASGSAHLVATDPATTAQPPAPSMAAHTVQQALFGSGQSSVRVDAASTTLPLHTITVPIMTHDSDKYTSYIMLFALFVVICLILISLLLQSEKENVLTDCSADLVPEIYKENAEIQY